LQSWTNISSDSCPLISWEKEASLSKAKEEDEVYEMRIALFARVPLEGA